MADTVIECEAMAELREGLTRRGIDWWDASTESIANGTIVMERTKFRMRGHTCSCIWGCNRPDAANPAAAGRFVLPISAGWPDRLECWYVPNDPDPVAMTASEVLDMVDGVMAS